MSDIEWTDETWNPVVGCDHVSEGCRNCYAEKMSNRPASMEHSEQYDDVVDDEGRFAGGAVNTVPKMLERPLHWDKPLRVFVNSMSDLFHPDVPFEFVDRVFAVMALADQHTFQILTKRPERMREYFESRRDELVRVGRQVNKLVRGGDYQARDDMPYEGDLRPDERALWNWPLPNVWLGVSVEDQDAADERIPPLLECPAEVRFLSCEPLLGPIDFDEVRIHEGMRKESDLDVLNGYETIDWVIAGGESGPGARPMHPDWVRSLRDQCDEADVPFFFKQWGAWKVAWDSREAVGNPDLWLSRYGEVFNEPQYTEDEKWMVKVGKDEAGRELDGETHDEFPEAPDPC